MPNTPIGMRECPTRVDGEPALFAHVIRTSTCQERQRGFFHKCPTCAHMNARNGAAARNGVHRNGSAAAVEPVNGAARLGRRLAAQRPS